MSLHFEYLQAMLLPANVSSQRKGWNPKEEGFIDLDRMSRAFDESDRFQKLSIPCIINLSRDKFGTPGRQGQGRKPRSHGQHLVGTAQLVSSADDRSEPAVVSTPTGNNLRLMTRC